VDGGRGGLDVAAGHQACFFVLAGRAQIPWIVGAPLVSALGEGRDGPCPYVVRYVAWRERASLA